MSRQQPGYSIIDVDEEEVTDTLFPYPVRWKSKPHLNILYAFTQNGGSRNPPAAGLEFKSSLLSFPYLVTAHTCSMSNDRC